MFRRLNRNTLLAFAGMLVGITGLLVQWAANPAKFSAAQGFFGLAFPPGILFIVLAGLLMLATARWCWHSVFGAFIAFWIVGVGGISGQLAPNLVSSNPGTVAGNVVMSAGLILAFGAGIASMVHARRARRLVRN
ncbi:hypothetical protein [Amycolatopsis australiensis]|uniref:SPW repeat-containing protein n=1 Tax=Amycolatopsis australiensis TaxID=546364 RepID=A0A1K1SSH9_9PSEU|nr:hypothetical protein [Amycolatopsis australiensis]SFW87031.1 hypothetical protein SAMN04489730_6574 [Amycolatopsis australiensis]